MNLKENEERSAVSILVIALIIISIIAVFFDIYFYGEFLSAKGISKWRLKLVNPKIIIEYLTSFLGLTLTILWLSPWLFILGVLHWPDLNMRKRL